MSRDIYVLEAPSGNISSNAKSPSAILISSMIYAVTATMSSNIYSLLFASILPVTLLIRKPINLVKINLINAVMILTLLLTWPEMKSGLIRGIIISLRVNMIYIVFSLKVYPLGVSGMYEALSALRVPEKLRVQILLTLRGIDILYERYETSIISVRQRAPEIGGILRLKIYAYILGNVLLQSLLRSEGIIRSVKCRGGFGGFNQSETHGINACDVLYVASFAVYGIIIAVMDYA